MATLFVNPAEKIVGATLTDSEFAVLSPCLVDPKGQQMVLDIFAGLIRQLSVDQRREIINRLMHTLEDASDDQLATMAQAITLKAQSVVA